MSVLRLKLSLSRGKTRTGMQERRAFHILEDKTALLFHTALVHKVEGTRIQSNVSDRACV